MVSNQFFVKKGPYPLKEIIKAIDCTNNYSNVKDFEIHGVESLVNAKENDMTFLNSSRYKDVSLKTKAAACITSSNLSKFLPNKCIKLNVKNILLAVTKVSKMFYPKADLDYPDINLIDSNEIKNKYPEVNFGKNVFIGKNVQIDKNTFVGSNCIIESNVKIGKNCVIGSLVIIKYSIINDYVCIKDGSKIGIKGFGFIPIGQKNIRTPQIGKVILGEGVEIGANCTIDRGSVSDTIIGRNTFLDNHIQIAHNVKIGTNCMMAAQVGIAGSTTIGDNTVIGGQAGISGHLKIGNNVKIGGASGVIRDIPDNSQVMGYPAVPLRDFVKMSFAEAGIALEFKGEGVNEKAFVISCANPEYQLEIGKEVLAIDPIYVRPTEVELLIGDATKAKEKLGWIPEYDLKFLVKEMMDSDLHLMQKKQYLKEGGYTTLNYF